MNAKQTLFDYLYQSLREQIISGRLPYGAEIPSMSQLCELYHVGIRTVRDVLYTLKNEGYIHTEERKAAVVVYKQTDMQKNDAVQSILQRKTSILEIYKTIAVLMPHLLYYSAQACSEDNLKTWFSTLERSKNKDFHSHWKTCTAFVYTLLENSNNLLFRDLYVSLEVYARTPFFQDYTQIVNRINRRNTFKNVLWVMESLLKKNAAETEMRFHLMYRAVLNIIEQYLDKLSHRFPDIQEDKSAVYSWAAERGRDHYYMQITRDLIDKIGTGLYQENTFLPSEAKLARQYGVCVTTIRKAVSMLNELGFGETVRAKGTKVIIQNNQTTIKCMKNKTYKQDTLLYLSGLHLMAIAIKPAAVLAFPKLDQAQQQHLREQFTQPGLVPVGCLTDCVIDCLELQPLKAILQEASKLLLWGYYFSLYNDRNRSKEILDKKSANAFEALCGGDAERFAEQLSACYWHILKAVRNYLLKRGLTEAKGFALPFDIENL